MAERDKASWFVYVIRLADTFSPADRDGVLARLRAEGIGCSDYFVPIHFQPHVAEQIGAKPGDFAVTERIAARTVALPFSGNLRESQIRRVHDCLAMAVKRAARPRRAASRRRAGRAGTRRAEPA